MDYPILPHNRADYDRLTSRKRIGIPVTVFVCGTVAIFTALLFPGINSNAVAIVSVAPLALFILFCVYAEVEKARIVLRDVREREEAQRES